jgi:hypothetical protein
VFVVDSPAPEALQIVFQRFGFPNAFVAVSFYVAKKLVDFSIESAVMFHPVTIIFPCGV